MKHLCLVVYMKSSTETWGVKTSFLDNGDLENGVDGAKRAS